MAALYEIDAAILACVDMETGEIIDAERLAELHMEREQKVEAVALWYKNLLSDAAAYKAEKDAFAEKERVAKAKAERLKQYLADALQGSKFKTTRVNISYRKSDSVVVDDIMQLPAQFLKYKDPEPDKLAIKQAITNGEVVDGARIETKQSVLIK
ncbi:MAG: siphovirus Gp157 family protein [Clostridia bacterium]|nr:siphovirus Gp157 family protein [Clostridia bacterium]